ncbi:MAG: S-adenosylmethionine decarboxylase [Candidatus Moranbacteria bacterium]|nr:S-adenosylmethionine decarboxylase [Candidatus Moranbacteria bacterium]MBP6034328.1 S-adenosylmethionine decarboxylase [Candidatus Moranbacteria bacterium]MBP7695807.1 S-adenosylmethionine decarboxylase [Candidatus Moranbacteria bacterium]
MAEQKHFGEHLTLDGYGGDHDKLNNKEVVLACLNNLPEELGMHKLSQPEIYWADGNDSKDPGGWSGFVVIEESHISIHTFPGRKFVSIDVYTCQNGLDRKFISGYFINKFGLQDTEENLVIRGTKYPENNLV